MTCCRRTVELLGKFEDTSPVQRGQIISERLLCMVIPEPDVDLMVDVDEAPAGDGCKSERYAMHSSGGCAGCHVYLDPVGMGLEAYDNLGRFRTHEPGRPECEIDGRGELAGVGPYQGPDGLGDALIASGLLEECVTTQLFRFAAGRHDVTVEEMAERFASGEHNMAELIVELIASPTFSHRRLPGGN